MVVGSPGTEVIDGCQLPCGCWDRNPEPLQEQQGALDLGANSPASSLPPHYYLFNIRSFEALCFQAGLTSCSSFSSLSFEC